MTHSQKSSTEIEFKLGELGDEFGLYRLDTETNGVFGERIIAELEDMLAELRTTQAHVRDLIKEEN